MLKPVLFALVGLAASVPAAFADTTLPLLPRPDLGRDFDPLAMPAPAQDAVDLCSRFGVACSIPFASPRADLGNLAELLPPAQADAAKRWALYADEWARIADLYRDGPRPALPALPQVPRTPDGLGWRPDRMSDLADLLDDVQARLARPSAPLQAVPHRDPLWSHPFTIRPFDPPTILPVPRPQHRGPSILIVPQQ
ncbi:hypothetical protein [Gymnodinialimonas ulvae]|uniref:hypothetical protein n=1 Tax=Gymnodinialimonas ulvae TaxID=3126504 RepID=UPI00309EEBF9